MIITTTTVALKVDLKGMEQVWAFCKALEIPKQDIKGISWQASFQNSRNIWRVFGAAVPRKLYAGYFRHAGKWEFLYVRDPRGLRRFSAPNILAIELKDSRFDRVLVTAPRSTGERIIKWHTS